MPSLRNYHNISSYDCSGKQLCYIDSNEANRKIATGDHEFFCVSCGAVKGEGPCLVRTNHLMALRQIEPEVMDDSKLKAGGGSACSLNKRDSARNVGITEGFLGYPANAGEIRRSRNRIASQASASLRNRAVTVVPRMRRFYPRERNAGRNLMMQLNKTDIIALATQSAAKYKLDPALVCAVIEQESNFDAGALRMEQGFYQRYVKPLLLPASESILRSSSFGLMQIMGEVAREYGFAGNFDLLCDPSTGLDYGCRHLAHKLEVAGGNVSKALDLWNGGGNPFYAAQVLARISHYPTP